MKLPNWKLIHERLSIIFKEGLSDRNYIVREMSAKSIFVLIYVNAIEGLDIWVRPDQITRMSDEQANKTDHSSRIYWQNKSIKSNTDIPGRWYATNTREPIRDETLRHLEINNALVQRELPTTSPRGRFALKKDFASLFDPELTGRELEQVILAWQNKFLSKEALARTALLNKSTVETGKGVLVNFPNGEARRLAAGPSSIITKGVVESFSKTFLQNPGVLWLSESAAKETYKDVKMLDTLGIKVEANIVLPDLLLVDLRKNGPVFIFVEVVASDGPINEERRNSLLNILCSANYKSENILFLTAFEDRSKPAFKKCFPSIAWNTFAWCMSEPNHIIALHKSLSSDKFSNLFD